MGTDQTVAGVEAFLDLLFMLWLALLAIVFIVRVVVHAIESRPLPPADYIARVRAGRD